MKYGLLGENLSHSYSKIIHERLGYEYELFSLKPSALDDFFKEGNFSGLNVTIPYKKTVMKYCDSLSELARRIGAVNTIYFDEGRLTGTNTDYAGFIYMCKKADINLEDKDVLILGSGGASAMACVAAKDMRAKKIFVATRSKIQSSSEVDDNKKIKVSYDNLPENIDILINTTPVGTYPDIDAKPVDLSYFDNLSGVIDLIYNPLKTALLMQADKLNIKNTGGLSMLVAQGTQASRLFRKDASTLKKSKIPGNNPFEKTTTENQKNFSSKGFTCLKTSQEESSDINHRILKWLTREIKNIVLVGMPSCGKSSLGREISKKTLRKFVDTDVIIKETYGRDPEIIISEDGVETFRNMESRVIKEVAKEHSLVIATGGGGVLREENVSALKQNGDIYFINRKLSLLTSEGRPLSRGDGRIAKLFEERMPVYTRIADAVVENDKELTKVAEKIIDIHFINS